MDKFEMRVRRIMELDSGVDPSRYGLKSILKRELKKDDSGVYVLYTPNDEEFDCLTISLKYFRILQKEFSNVNIVCGKDIHNVWKNHTYLMVDGLVVDFTPIYPTIGADHKLERILNDDEITKYESLSKIHLDCLTPVYYQPENKTLFLVRTTKESGRYVHVKLRKYGCIVTKIDFDQTMPKGEVVNENAFPSEIKKDLCGFIKSLRNV